MTKQPSEPTIKKVRSGTCKTLSGKSDLSYDLGTDPSKVIHVKISKNSGGGFFSKEWVSWSAIEAALEAEEPITSICLRPLFRGRSVNTSGFLLATLLAEGVVETVADKKRHFALTGKKLSTGKPSARKKPARKTRKR